MSNEVQNYINGTKVRVKDCATNYVVCETIERLDLMNFNGEIQYLSGEGVEEGYYVVGETETLYMQDIPRWEFL